VSEFAPGLVTTSTPANPTRSAAQKAGALLQPQDRYQRSKERAEELIETAPASGINVKASANNVRDVAWDKPRARWSRGRWVAKTASPVIGSMTALQTSGEEIERANTTSPTG
jgi:hypothetical protein